MSATAHDLRQCSVDGPIHAHQVDVEHTLERLRGGRAEGRRARGDAGVRNDHVEPAEPLHRSRDRSLHRAPIGDVTGEAERPRVVHLRGRARRRLRLEVDNHHRCAARDQRPRGRKADPASAAGHESDLAA